MRRSGLRKERQARGVRWGDGFRACEDCGSHSNVYECDWCRGHRDGVDCWHPSGVLVVKEERL